MWVNSGNENFPDYLTEEEYNYIHGGCGSEARKRIEQEEDEYWDFMCDMENGK